MNKLALASLSAILSIFFMSSAALAEDPSLGVSESVVDVYNGDETSIDLTITNQDDVPRTFSITVFPTIWNNVLVDPEMNLIHLGGGETGTMKIFFNALYEAEKGASEFVITATDTNDDNIESNSTVQLRVSYRTPIFITDVKADQISYNPGNVVAIETEITNEGTVDSDELSLQTIISFNGENLKIFDPVLLTLRGRASVSNGESFQIEKHQAPGQYEIESVLRDRFGFTVSRKTVEFTVNEFAGVPAKDSDTSFGFLSASTIVTAKHEGNVPSEIELTVVVPSFAKDLFISETDYTDVEEKTGVTVYRYVSPILNPGQEYVIKYQFSLWQVWASAIIIVAIIWLAFRFVFTPTIVKTYRRGALNKNSETLVTLEVKNRSLSTIRDLVIRDFVPHIVKVDTKFETLKPMMKETREGTELTWRFDSLNGREERIVTYRIKPVMDITGTLRLPTATMHYATKKKLKRDTVSREIIERFRK